MNYSKVQLGNMLLEALHKCRTSDGEGYYIKTQDLFDKVEYTNEWGTQATGLPVKFHQRCRGYLDDLYNAGVIDKWGTSVGQRKWKINVDEWEGVDPFKRVGDLKKPIEPVKQTFHESDPYDDRPSKEEYDRMKQELAQVKTDMSNLHTAFGVVTNRVIDLTKEVESSKARVKELVVKQYQKKTVKLKDVVLPKVFDKVLALANCRRPVLLVGPAGCGKSHLAKLVADSLGLDFDAMSCTAGMSESHLLGRSVPDLTHGKNRFQGTAFLDRYEKGGLFLLDEMDAADPNLLLAINTALANGYCNVPNRTASPKAVQHDDFIAIATANTFGRGATRQYAGRSQLDEATLDRFRIGTVECDYDMAVEEAVCPDAALRAKCWDVRRKIEQAGLRRVMSTRFMADAHTMVSQAGWTIDDVMQQFVSGWTKEEVSKVLTA